MLSLGSLPEVPRKIKTKQGVFQNFFPTTKEIEIFSVLTDFRFCATPLTEFLIVLAMILDVSFPASSPGNRRACHWA